MNLRKLALLTLLGLAVLGYFHFGLGQFLSFAALKAQQQALATALAENPWTVGALYFASYVAVAALSLPGAALMTLAGGAIFGLGWGVLIVSFASSVGATLAFLAARFLLRDWIAARFGERLRAVDEGVRREGAFYLFTLRLIPVVPYFLVNLLFGLTAMRVRTYYGVSQLGMLAATVVYVNAGTRLAELDSPAAIASPGLLLSFTLLGVFPLLARRLVDHLRARRIYARWPRPASFDRNLIVVGGGSAGLVTAYLAATLKAKVTLIEQNRMGGDCLNTGCVPSKALLRAARLQAAIGRAGEFGIAATTKPDFAAVMARVREVIRQIEPHDSAARYTGLGVEVIAGHARLVSPWQVEIAAADGATRRLSARAIVLATGARPTVPDIPGLAEVGYLTSDNVWELDQLPRRLLVLGGGPIGCELAQAMARFGSQVTLLEQAPRLLGREDAEVSERVAARFVAEGIELRLEHEAERFALAGSDKVLYASHRGTAVHLVFDAVLVAVGRSARLAGYGLDGLGIVSAQTITTNSFLQTSYPNIYAAGDVAGPYQFTHAAAHQAGYAALNALFSPLKKFRIDYSLIPAATFTEPEVARIGLNEAEARAQGVACEVSLFPLAELDRAITDGTTDGFIKVLTVPGKDRILGVTIVGEHAGELIAEYVLAMKNGIGLKSILSTIHIYPTLAEANKSVAGVWARAHAPQHLLAWAARFHNWRRG